MTNGDVGEKRLEYECSKLDITLSKPVEKAPYDYVLEREGRLYKIQVKTTRETEEGSAKADFRRTNMTAEGANRKSYNSDEVDYYVVCVRPSDNLYIIDYDEINTESFKLTLPERQEELEERYAKQTNLATDYGFIDNVPEL